MAEAPILVTAALPYANGPLHLGHIAGVYLPADIYVRYQRLRGRDIRFICGSDEFGVPITLRAEKEGISPQAVVDRFHENIRESFTTLGISFDHYSRTTSDIHRETAQDFFRVLHDKGLLKEKRQEQLYDEKLQRFLPDRFVVGTCPHCDFAKARGDQCDNCGKLVDQLALLDPRSTLSGETPVVRQTTHWFLPLGEMQQELEPLLEKTWKEAAHPWRDNVVNFCRGWFSEGLNDRAVTRDLSWGIPVPLEGAEGKVLYVWFDAPIGYISATKEWAVQQGDPDLWKRYWRTDGAGPPARLIHFIGKDNIVFHAILFPAMLLKYGGYVLPDYVPANEYLTIEGRKISTSENYAVWLPDYLARFAPDPLRYCLTAIAPETRDADFSWKDFQNRNNFELADILGNFINRTLTFAQRYFEGKVPEESARKAMDRAMLEETVKAAVTIGRKLENFQVRDSQRALMDLARAANKYFNDTEPWHTAKTDRARCATTINICLQVVATFATLMEPFLPFSATALAGQLGRDVTPDDWNRLAEGSIRELPTGHVLGTPAILFPKIEDEDIKPEVQRLAAIAKDNGNDAPTETAAEEPALITFDEFQKMDLRVATIVSAEPIPKAKRLLKLIVDDGERSDRQIVAGIAEHFDPATLAGRQIVIVANLQPVTLMGVESQGMLLAATDDSGPALLTPADPRPNGTRVG